MGRPPVVPVKKKTRIVLSLLAGEVTMAESGGREKVVGDLDWDVEGPVADLTSALGEAHPEVRVRKTNAENRLGPSRTSR